MASQFVYGLIHPWGSVSGLSLLVLVSGVTFIKERIFGVSHSHKLIVVPFRFWGLLFKIGIG